MNAQGLEALILKIMMEVTDDNKNTIRTKQQDLHYTTLEYDYKVELKVEAFGSDTQVSVKDFVSSFNKILAAGTFEYADTIKHTINGKTMYCTVSTTSKPDDSKRAIH